MFMPIYLIGMVKKCAYQRNVGHWPILTIKIALCTPLCYIFYATWLRCQTNRPGSTPYSLHIIISMVIALTQIIIEWHRWHHWNPECNLSHSFEHFEVWCRQYMNQWSNRAVLGLSPSGCCHNGHYIICWAFLSFVSTQSTSKQIDFRSM